MIVSESMYRAHDAVWNAFVAGGKIEPAFGSRSSPETLHLVFLCPVGGWRGIGRFVAPFQQPLDFPYADLVPAERLHVSIQGFNIDRSDWVAERRDEVLSAAGEVFASFPPLTLWLGWLNSFPMATFLHAEDGGMIRKMRAELRRALPAWTGVADDPMVRDGRDEWLPHLSLAYYNTVHDNRALVEAIRPMRQEILAVATFREIQLISTPADLTSPDRWMWPVHGVFELGGLDQE